MRYAYDLSPYGGPSKLATLAGISRMTLWRALHHIKCGEQTALQIERATNGAIPSSQLWPIDRTPDNAA